MFSFSQYFVAYWSSGSYYSAYCLLHHHLSAHVDKHVEKIMWAEEVQILDYTDLDQWVISVNIASSHEWWLQVSCFCPFLLWSKPYSYPYLVSLLGRDSSGIGVEWVHVQTDIDSAGPFFCFLHLKGNRYGQLTICCLLSLSLWSLVLMQPNFDALVEPLEICEQQTGSAVPRFTPVVYGDHVIGKVLTNFG